MNKKIKKITILLLLLLIFTTIQTISATNLEVDNTNYNNYFSTTGTNNINDGDTVTIKEDLTDKDIIIDKNITLNSNNNIILTDSTITLTKTSNGATIKNLNIKGTNNLITINEATDITIDNNKLTTNGISSSTIYATNTNNLKIINNEISSTGLNNPNFLYSISIIDSQNTIIQSNKIKTNSTAYIVQYDSNDNPTYKTLSIYISNSKKTTIQDNNIITDYNQATGGLDTVLSLYAINSEDLTIKTNDITTNGNRYAYGVAFKNNPNLSLTNNKIITTGKNYANGISIVGNQGGSFEFNTITLNAENVTYGIITGTIDGALLSSSYKNNTINTKSTYSVGMELVGLGYNNITGNYIKTDATYGIGIGLLAGSQGNAISSNTIISTGTKTDSQNYNDLLDFENAGITMQARDDENGNSGLNYIRYNNITVNGKYTINLRNTTSNSVHHNYLVSNEFIGDESVYSSSTNSNIYENTPKPESSDIIYVSSKGSDSNKGTKDKPLLNLATAVKRVLVGGEIIILDDINTNGIYIEKSMTITGLNPDVTIDGEGKDLFYIRSEISGVEKVIIQNLSLTNCTIAGGSVIISFAPELYLYNITMYNNTEETSSSGFYGPISIYGNLYVEDCLFYNNRGNSGGAIYCTGNLTVVNSIFHDNEASYHGGAIAMGQASAYSTTNLKIINSTFYNNEANNYGGAIYGQSNYLTVNHSVFVNNKASAGGFYYTYGNMYTTSNIQYSVIYNNPSSYGDIYTYMQNVRANYNWWGDNGGSTNRYQYGDGYPVTMDLSRPVIMTLNLNETIVDSVPTTITASLNKYLYRGTLLDLSDSIPSRNAIFSSNSGIFSQSNVLTTEGVASSRYTGRSEGMLNVTIDGQTISLNTTVVTKDITLSLNSTSFQSNGDVSPVILITDSNNLPVATGILTISFSGENYYASVNNGVSRVNLGTLSVGDYDLSVAYSPIDNRYNSGSDSFTIHVLQASSPSNPDAPINPIDPSPNNGTSLGNISLTLVEDNIVGVIGDNITVGVNVLSSEGIIVDKGVVTLNLNNTVYRANVSEGVANILVTLPNTSGAYTSFITYIGDTQTSTIKTTITVKENMNDTLGTVLTIGLNEINDTQEIVGILTDENGNTHDSEVNITLTRLSNQASKTYTTTTINGKYTLKLNLAPGDYSAKANYNGDEQYKPSQTETTLITITGKTQNAKLDDENIINKTYGEKISYDGTLTDNNGNKLIGYHIAVNITRLSSGASKTYYLTTDYNGKYTLPINLAPGEYTLHTTINDNNYTAASLTHLTITNNQTNPQLQTENTIIHYNNNEKYTGKLLNENQEPIAGQHIDLTLSNTRGQSKTYDVVTDYTGTFNLPINLAPGTYTAQSSYKGTSTYAPISSTNTITVQ